MRGETGLERTFVAFSIMRREERRRKEFYKYNSEGNRGRGNDVIFRDGNKGGGNAKRQDK